jgi:hypothetical protein
MSPRFGITGGNLYEIEIDNNAIPHPGDMDGPTVRNLRDYQAAVSERQSTSDLLHEEPELVRCAPQTWHALDYSR